MGLFTPKANTMTERHIVVLTLDIDPETHSDPVDWDWHALLQLTPEEGVVATSYRAEEWLDIRLHLTEAGPEEV